MSHLKFKGLVLLATILISCKHINNNFPKRIELKNLKSVTPIKLSDLNIVDIDYIPLETISASMIPEFYKILYDGKDFYIQTLSGVMIFDSYGKFSSSIGKIGRGPQEYQYCNDFSISTKNHYIYILSVQEAKIVVFNKQGNFIKKLKIPARTTNINCFENGILCYSYNTMGEIDYSFNVIDYDGKHIKAFPNKHQFNYTPFGVLFGEEFFCYKQNDTLFIKELFSDTIFSFVDLQFTPTIILDHGGKTIPATAKEDIKEIGDMFKIKNEYIIDHELLSFGNYVYLTFEFKNQAYMLISSLFNNVHYLSKYEDGIRNDFDCGLNFYPKIALNNSTILGWIYPVNLKNHIATDFFKRSIPKDYCKKQKLKQLANTLDANDNPVLMIVKLKD